MAKRKADPKWKEFEDAVARFIAAMGPNARVILNAFTPDSDTKRRRQRDVWIEDTVYGLFPLRIHVSCKRYKRKLDQGHIDTFVGELASSGAHKGVLFSYRGFNQAAVEKAKARGICCCRLFMDEPAELPDAFRFSAYLCAPQLQLRLPRLPPSRRLITWGDLFGSSIGASGVTVLDALADAYKQAEERHLKEFPGKTATPTHAAFKVTLCFASGGPDLEIVGRIRWKTYKAKLSAVLLNGSYSYTTGDFVGRVASPFFDVRSAEPGPGWELLDAPPASAKNTILAVLSGPDVRKTLVEDMGSAPIRR